MTKAEKRAMNFYPVLFSERIGLDKIRPQVRVGFENGYETACQDIRSWLIEKKKDVGGGLSEYDMGEENGKYEIISNLLSELEQITNHK